MTIEQTMILGELIIIFILAFILSEIDKLKRKKGVDEK